ncbi:MAG: 30S ribosomal protein S24e [Methanomicrobium sp.]|jgi:Ribosomal protein S24E|uniref:30S ribosomal protein S24e n=1 Tax=Methanomicrobium mobile TaxID=2205 RepID=UPI0005B2617F|nr:30S ribosomal protein S24 [Methanomicrobium mobile]MBP5082867.1 30S ribosomal protein S24e [Methanomicrobium sp.]MBP5475382.1 30S ribosomal protein S24e [Methanomicrobium sp.]
MDFEFTRDNENKLLNRTELEFVLKYEGATPSRQDVLGKLCALRNIETEKCVVDSFKCEFGKQEIKGTARIYGSADELKATELEYVVKRCQAKEAAPAEEA